MRPARRVRRSLALPPPFVCTPALQQREIGIAGQMLELGVWWRAARARRACEPVRRGATGRAASRAQSAGARACGGKGRRPGEGWSR